MKTTYASKALILGRVKVGNPKLQIVIDRARRIAIERAKNEIPNFVDSRIS